MVDIGVAPTSVWAQRGFPNLWIGLTASEFGSQLSRFALPLVAVLVLNAGSAQVGMLTAVARLPYVLVALFAGVLVDRFAPRRMLIAADLGRFAILLCVPLLTRAHITGLRWLYVAAFAVGCFTVLFDVASQSYLPRIVDRAGLAAGNGALEASGASASIVGPAAGGLLVQSLTAPLAMVAGALAYLGSVIAVLGTPRVTGAPDHTDDAGVLSQIWAGLRIVFGNEILRVMAVVAGIYNLFFAGFQTVNLLYLTRKLRLSPAEIGVVLGALGPGLLVGAALAAWAARRIGYGRAVLITTVGANGIVQCVAAVPGNGWMSVTALVAINFGFGICGLSHAMLMRTIRQALTPETFLGRVAATNRFLAQGATPIGALLGGLLAAAFDLRLALVTTTLGMLSVVVILLLSPLPRIGKELPGIDTEVPRWSP